MINSRLWLVLTSLVGLGHPCQQDPIPFAEKNKSSCWSIKPAFTKYPSFFSEKKVTAQPVESKV
jgi:hypothetical protein